MTLATLTVLLACARHEAPPSATSSPSAAPEGAVLVQASEPVPCDAPPPLPPEGAPTPQNQPPPPGDGPTLALSRAWFYKEGGRPVPGPAQLLIFRETPAGWVSSKLEDADSNVFHQSFRLGQGLVTLGAQRALLRLWTPGPEGWSASTLFEGDWCGKFDRLRELERANVDRDRPEEWVIATHDQGGVVVLEGIPGRQRALELDRQPDTFVHEIELGDLDGDGVDEIVATRTQRTGTGTRSEVVRYRWTEAGYLRETLLVDEQAAIHEVLLADLDGDQQEELYVSVPRVPEEKGGEPWVELQRLRVKRGAWTAETVARVEDRSVRFLLDADLDGDGARELVATGMRHGVYRLEPRRRGLWPVSHISASSSGFEHAALALDLNHDGREELYVADDDQGELERLSLDPATGDWLGEVLGTYGKDSFTWNIAPGP